MRYILALISIVCFVSCQEFEDIDTAVHALPNSSVQKIKLADSLGYISLVTPDRYDTFFHWGYEPGCGLRIEIEEYRFQSKKYEIYKESGMIDTNHSRPDLVDQITISHGLFIPSAGDTDSSIIYNYHAKRKHDLLIIPETYKIKSDTIEIVNGRYLSTFIIDLEDSMAHYVTKKVIAAILIRNNTIEIQYEFKANERDSISDNFIAHSLELLKTIKVKN